MGKITQNPDGTYSMQGFSTSNPDDIKALSEKFGFARKGVPIEKTEDKSPLMIKPKKKV